MKKIKKVRVEMHFILRTYEQSQVLTRELERIAESGIVATLIREVDFEDYGNDETSDGET